MAITKVVLEKADNLCIVKIGRKVVTGKVIKYTQERASELERIVLEINSDLEATVEEGDE